MLELQEVQDWKVKAEANIEALNSAFDEEKGQGLQQGCGGQGAPRSARCCK